MILQAHIVKRRNTTFFSYKQHPKELGIVKLLVGSKTFNGSLDEFTALSFCILNLDQKSSMDLWREFTPMPSLTVHQTELRCIGFHLLSGTALYSSALLQTPRHYLYFISLFRNCICILSLYLYYLTQKSCKLAHSVSRQHFLLGLKKRGSLLVSDHHRATTHWDHH